MRYPVVLPRADCARMETVMTAIARGRWGPWTLHYEAGAEGRDALVLRHERAEYDVRPRRGDRSIERVASKPWATAEDVGHLVFALRDLDAAATLGLLP